MTILKLSGNTSKRGASASKSRVRAKKKHRGLKTFVFVLLFFAVAAAAYFLWETPPEHAAEGLTTFTGAPVSSTAAPSAAPSPSPTPTADPNAVLHNDSMYTFLLVGKDKVAGNTDTIMVGALDTENHTINVVSIPRDTLVNTPGSIKKINTLYDVSLNAGGNGIDGLMDGVKDIMGFSVDNYIVVNLTAFEKLVDAIGGVYYDVPVDMYYYDPNQDLSISIAKGYQLLDGENALKVCRFRAGYADADIGRIRTQQDFLKTVAKQMLTLGNIPNLPKIIDIFQEYVETNLTSANISFFAREFLACSSDGISFSTMPGNYNDSVGGFSYVTIDIDGWLDVVNTQLNPWSKDVTVDNVDILTRDSSGSLYATTGTIKGGANSFLTMDEYLSQQG